MKRLALLLMLCATSAFAGTASVTVDANGNVLNSTPTNFPTGKLKVNGVAVTGGSGTGNLSATGSPVSGDVPIFRSPSTLGPASADEVWRFTVPILPSVAGHDTVNPVLYVLQNDPALPGDSPTSVPTEYAVKHFIQGYTFGWDQIDFTASDLADLGTRNFSDLQNKPTTLAGYGITDAQPLDVADSAARLALTGIVVGQLTRQLDADITYRLKTPLAEVGGIVVSASAGTPEIDGVYTKRTILGQINGKDYYDQVGWDANDGHHQIAWNGDMSDPPIYRWEISGSGLAEFYSLSDVATPDLATNWKFANGDPAPVSVVAEDKWEVAGFRPGDSTLLGDVITAGGPIGSSTIVPVITYNAAGQLTAVTTASISSGLTIGTTTIASGTGSTKVLYDNSGVLAETAAPTLTGTNFTGIPTAGLSDGAVTLAKMADITGPVVLGRTTADATGAPKALTLGTGVLTALSTLPNATGGVVLFSGALGTPTSGVGTNLTALNASNLSSGTVPTARLGSGTANSGSFLRGDQTWTAVTVPTIASTSSVLKGDGAGNAVAATAGTDFVKATTATTYTAGAKQSVQASATTAGFNFGGVTADPSSVASGDLWFRTDTPGLKYYDGTANRTVANLAQAQAFTNKDLTGSGNTFPTFNQNTTGSAASLSVSGQTGKMTVTGLTSTDRAKTVRDAADTILELGGSYTPTGTWIFSAAGAASAPAMKYSGTPFAGTGTTSFPLLYINDSTATASTTLNTAGTAFGVNSHGTQDLINLLKDGTSQFKVSSGGTATLTGAVLVKDGSASSPGLSFAGQTSTGFYRVTDGQIGASSIYGGCLWKSGNGPGLAVRGTLAMGFATGDPDSTNLDAAFSRNAAGVIEVNNGTAGTYRDIKVRTAQSAGTTYANLPTAAAGMMSYITDGATGNCGDALCTTWGATVTGGGGSLKLLVWYNGTNWTLIGK